LRKWHRHTEVLCNEYQYNLTSVTLAAVQQCTGCQGNSYVGSHHQCCYWYYHRYGVACDMETHSYIGLKRNTSLSRNHRDKTILYPETPIISSERLKIESWSHWNISFRLIRTTMYHWNIIWCHFLQNKIKWNFYIFGSHLNMRTCSKLGCRE
jgi:hypothetical protein